ncbi:MAG: DUF2961 domain-containing protein [Candidatus Lokiarchaeota archaeon]|nr:DUF2961 domain-containing protein [Candidatus Lokiarchaeota archaeon]
MDSTVFGSNLANIARLRRFRRKRESSYDRTGGNNDFLVLQANERRVIFDQDGPSSIKHIWMTMATIGGKQNWLRNIIVRMYWDFEEYPSVEVPISDFFGMGHGECKNFVSTPFQMSPRSGKGFNCWWPMPFKKHAMIEIENQLDKKFTLYYYVDYEKYEKLPEDPLEPLGYFHAQFRQSKLEKDQRNDRDTGKRFTKIQWQVSGGKNTYDNMGYDLNHTILHARGKGQYVGCHLNIDNKSRFFILNWPGEGDDMIFIDEDVGKEPTLYGTGTEDYVNTAYGPRTEYNAPYHGIIKPGGFNWNGKITYYRYHIPDPIPFENEIIVSIERGHDNHRLADRWESTSYWYQMEPHEPFPQLPSKKERQPRKTRGWQIIKWFLKWIGKLMLAGMFVYFLFWLYFTHFK